MKVYEGGCLFPKVSCGFLVRVEGKPMTIDENFIVNTLRDREQYHVVPIEECPFEKWTCPNDEQDSSVIGENPDAVG